MTVPLTALDSVAALVVIDLQRGVVGIPAAHSVADVIGRTAQLTRAFRQRGLPVVLVRVTGQRQEDGTVTFAAGPGRGRTDAGMRRFSPPPDWDELVPELKPEADELIITKPRWSALVGTSLDEDLRRLGVSQVFLTGIATSIGVESTARSAHDLGYNVVLVVDAMTDRDLEAHRQSVERLFPRLGETCTTAEVLNLLGEVPAR